MFKYSIYGILLIIPFCSNVKASYDLHIKTSGSAILGSEIHFSAELYKNGQLAPETEYKYSWSDNTARSNSNTIESSKPYSNWSVVYSKEHYSPGTYEAHLAVDIKYFYVWFPLTEGSVKFHLNDLLSGNLSLIQNGTERKSQFVSNLMPVNHTVILTESDYVYMKNNTTYVTTYWFQNCVYMGLTNGLTFMNIYNKENEEYEIEALVIGSFDKLPDPTTTTTTTTPTPTTTTTTSTTTTTTTTTTTSTTTPKPNPNFSSVLEENTTTGFGPTSAISPKRSKREVNTSISTTATQATDKADQNEVEVSPYGVEINIKNITKQLKEGLINESQIAAVMSAPEAGESTAVVSTATQTDIPSFANQPFICFNKSQVAPDPNKIYGYFHRKIVPKVPVANLTYSGSIWLQHGDVLNLKVKCTGSPPFEYCIKIFTGPYNATGNETCLVWQSLTSCEFPFTHYFQTTQVHSVVFVVRNPIAKVVKEVAINFYEAKKQSQLSVIVVPVSFSLVAVIIVVFGVAYYIQNKNRFIVEVADFNFGETSSVDMEYKTFQQRLFDSIRQVLHRPRRNSDSGSSPTGENSLKYGSMT